MWFSFCSTAFCLPSTTSDLEHTVLLRKRMLLDTDCFTWGVFPPFSPLWLIPGVGAPQTHAGCTGLGAIFAFCYVSLWIGLVTFPIPRVLGKMGLTEPTTIPASESLRKRFLPAWTTFPCFTTRWESETGLSPLRPYPDGNSEGS